MSKSLNRHTIEVLETLLEESRYENERLRDLLLECKPFLEDWVHAGEIWDKIKKELSDER